MWLFQSNRQLQQLIHLRFLFVVLQLVALVVSQYWLEYELVYVTLYGIVFVEVLINLVCWYFYRTPRNAIAAEYLLQLSLDIGVLTLLLYYSGGATNPFVSLLLLPVAIGAVTLPKPLALLIASLGLSAYSALLFSLSPHALHMMDMQEHFVGMWLNFVVSAAVVLVIVASLVKTMNKQQQQLQERREEQLRQEQVVSLGSAAAQFAHQLATPLGTAHLIVEELQEQQNDTSATEVEELQEQLQLCSLRLQQFRDMAERVRSGDVTQQSFSAFISALKGELQLNFAAVEFQYKVDSSLADFKVADDGSLIPALMNLVQNAVQASNTAGQNRVAIVAESASGKAQILIRDFGMGLSETHLMQLGTQLVDSEKGLGMGVMLSHATLERLGGALKIYNHPEGGAVAEVSLGSISHDG